MYSLYLYPLVLPSILNSGNLFIDIASFPVTMFAYLFNRSSFVFLLSIFDKPRLINLSSYVRVLLPSPLIALVVLLCIPSNYTLSFIVTWCVAIDPNTTPFQVTEFTQDWLTGKTQGWRHYPLVWRIRSSDVIVVSRRLSAPDSQVVRLFVVQL